MQINYHWLYGHWTFTGLEEPAASPAKNKTKKKHKRSHKLQEGNMSDDYGKCSTGADVVRKVLHRFWVHFIHYYFARNVIMMH